ncbi:MAG: L-2-hydroxyglutarate oxidase, partial [Flavobacteriales bacterium]
MDDIAPGRAGVRAMLLAADGSMVDDFRIERRGNRIHVLNAPSPAATAALAIGERITEMAAEAWGLHC